MRVYGSSHWSIPFTIGFLSIGPLVYSIERQHDVHQCSQISMTMAHTKNVWALVDGLEFLLMSRELTQRMKGLSKQGIVANLCPFGGSLENNWRDNVLDWIVMLVHLTCPINTIKISVTIANHKIVHWRFQVKLSRHETRENAKHPSTCNWILQSAW